MPVISVDTVEEISGYLDHGGHGHASCAADEVPSELNDGR
jgi:hypothetical protein